MNLISKMFDGEKLTIIPNNGDPIFLLKDVCSILELGQVAGVKRRLSDDVISNHPIIDSLGRTQQATFINEDGLYDVILDSRKPEAKRFRKYVTNEVLPSIRKTGGYVQENRAIDFVDNWMPDLDDVSKQAIASTLETNRKLMTENKKLNTAIQEQRPKVVFAEAYEVSDDTITVKEMANLLKQKGIDTGEQRLYRWLREHGYICSKGSYYNLPTQRALDMGLFQIKKGVRTGTGGALRQTRTTKVTGKGQVYFVNKFIGQASAI
ncbi:phage antirepressor KilAC domain-containing protein [Terribacillus sp. 179-K 1B1 HS]|uniref:phage antirepressor KilAC domain-containing protein n=1 Tax=Terribacillus sp. 179-K 1B1 HS TaxID=3142388 RepID=UPI0039A31013